MGEEKVAYKKKRIYDPELEGFPYATMKIKEPVVEEFRKLAEETRQEQTKLLAELIESYKKNSATSKGQAYQFP